MRINEAAADTALLHLSFSTYQQQDWSSTSYSSSNLPIPQMQFPCPRLCTYSTQNSTGAPAGAMREQIPPSPSPSQLQPTDPSAAGRARVRWWLAEPTQFRASKSGLQQAREVNKFQHDEKVGLGRKLLLSSAQQGAVRRPISRERMQTHGHARADPHPHTIVFGQY